MFRTDRIEEASQQSSPSCTKNLMEEFESGSGNRKRKLRLDDFMKELEHNLECIDNRDINGLESHREPRKTAPVRQSRVLTAEDDYVVKDEETRVFMEAVYPNYEQPESSIPLKEFISQAILYFFPEVNPSPEVLSSVRKHTQKLLTTTSAQTLSVNALSVVTKSTPLRLVLLEHLLAAQHRQLTQRLQQEHQQILVEFTKLEKEIKAEKELQQKKARELKDKELAVRDKEKEVASREKELKDKLQKEYDKKVELFAKFMEEATGQLDKRASTIERNIKYKIHILDNRLEEVSKIKEHKFAVDTKHKQKIIRLEKQNQHLRSQCRKIDQITADYLKEKEGLTKKIILLQEKIAKFQKKNGNLKQQLAGKDELVKVISGKMDELKKLNSNLKQQLNKDHQKKQSEQAQLTDKTPRSTDNNKTSTKTFIRLLNSLLSTAQRSIPKIILFYRQQPKRPMDFELVEVFYSNQKQLNILFISFLTELLSTEKNSQKSCLLTQSLTIIDFLIKMALFSFNFKYSKERNDNILKSPLKQRQQSLFSYFANSQLSQKCLKIAKKSQKSIQKQDVTIEYCLLSFLLASTAQYLQSSLSFMCSQITSSLNLLERFLNYDIFTYLLLKTSSFPLLSSVVIDIILQCCSNDTLSRTLSLLQQSETYLLLLKVLLTPLQPSDVEKLSIVLQRYSYVYKKDMVIEKEIQAIMKKMMGEFEGNKERLIAANFKSILNSST